MMPPLPSFAWNSFTAAFGEAHPWPLGIWRRRMFWASGDGLLRVLEIIRFADVEAICRVCINCSRRLPNRTTANELGLVGLRFHPWRFEFTCAIEELPQIAPWLAQLDQAHDEAEATPPAPPVALWVWGASLDASEYIWTASGVRRYEQLFPKNKVATWLAWHLPGLSVPEQHAPP